MGALNASVATAAKADLTWRETVGAYVSLTKPRIISLLLITTIPAMILAEQGMPSAWLIAATVLGGTLAAGGANAINCYIDRDIDEIMHRTQGRPLPMGKLEPLHALVFALALEVAAFALLVATSNLLAGVLALSATAFYVFVYTMWLKRTSRQNIVIGGAAGAVPPLVGYAAATGSLALPALWLFLIVFLWTPPHFWALALMIKNAYAAAGVPMLPVVRGERETARQIVLYSLALFAFTVVVGLWLGPLYTAAAIVLGAVFVALAVLLRRDLSRARAQLLFHYSLLYLALLFTAAALDPVVL